MKTRKVNLRPNQKAAHVDTQNDVQITPTTLLIGIICVFAILIPLIFIKT